MIGNEEDFTAVPRLPRRRRGRKPPAHRRDRVQADDRDRGEDVPELQGHRHHAARRDDRDASTTGPPSPGLDGKFYESRKYPDLEIFDRVGGGDSFATGFIYGLMTGRRRKKAVDYGAAHGALAMTTPGDTSMADQAEVEKVMKGGTARASR